MNATAMTTMTGGAAGALRDLRAGFHGSVHLPGEDGYDQRRQAMRPIDARPAIVAEAAGPEDVRAAVLAARRHDLPFAVQATGHGTLIPSHGGVLLKTSRMSAVLVDAHRRVARAGPGARWSQVIAAAAPFGLAPLAGSAPDVGVAGYTFGGGLGWLSRRYGYAADSLLRAEIVTADGRLVKADADRHADLWWAVRGGGGNFGVATGLEFRLHPVERVYAGTVYFPIERAAGLLAAYAEHAPGMPDELAAHVVVTKDGPAGPAASVRGLYVGDAEAGERALRPLLRAGGRPASGGFRAMDYPETAAVGGTAPKGFELYERLPEPAIRAVVDAVTSGPAAAIEVRLWGGAMARPGPDGGPIGHRHVPYSISVDGPPEAVAPLRRYAHGGSFLNFLGDPSRTADAYTPADLSALREVKRAYDPENFFRLHHDIDPTGRR